MVRAFHFFYEGQTQEWALINVNSCDQGLQRWWNLRQQQRLWSRYQHCRLVRLLPCCRTGAQLWVCLVRKGFHQGMKRKIRVEQEDTDLCVAIHLDHRYSAHRLRFRDCNLYAVEKVLVRWYRFLDLCHIYSGLFHLLDTSHTLQCCYAANQVSPMMDRHMNITCSHLCQH